MKLEDERRTRLALLSLLLIGAVLLVYWPAARALGNLWLDDERRTYTHGFLVAAVAVWLLWRSRVLAIRRETAADPALHSLALLAVLSVVVIAWQLAFRAGIELAIELLLLPLMWLAVRLIIGKDAGRAAFLPVTYLGFALTAWDYLNPAAQAVSVHAVRLMLRVVGIPAYFEGNDVQIPAGRFEIAEGCSGLHFIIVALAVATLMGELRGDTWRLRVRWWLTALLLAVTANWLRIFVIIVMGHLTNMQTYLVRGSHYGFGWALFSAALFVLFMFERRTPLPEAVTEAPPGSAAAGIAATPRGGALWISLVSILFLVAPMLLEQLIRARSADVIPSGAQVPAHAGWVTVDSRELSWHPRQQQADSESRLRFENGLLAVDLYRADYLEQRPGKKLGGQTNNLAGSAAALAAGGESAAGQRFGSMTLVEDGQQFLLWFNYRVDGRVFTSALPAQLWYSWRALRFARSSDSTVLALRAPCAPDCAAARVALERFATDMKDFL
jgi:exosortase